MTDRTKIDCANCGGDIGDRISHDGAAAVKCRNCGHVRVLRYRRPSEKSLQGRDTAEQTLKRLLEA